MDKVFSLQADKPGARLDRYITEKYPHISRTLAQKLIADGFITVNNHTAKASLKLNAGDHLTITLPAAPGPPQPENIPLNIVYQDEDLIVIDKQAGLPTHPAPGHPGHTIVNALLARFPGLPIDDDPDRPGIVHRLDKDTSGLMLIARNKQALDNLKAQFKERSVKKAYLVLAKGHLSPENGVIDAPIGRDPNNRKRMAVVTSGREARTEFSVIRYTGSYSLLEVRPETGRTHQIRVHLAAIGHPVVGDATYGGKSTLVPRQFVHACRLGFKLPSSGEYVEFTSELPPYLEQALKSIT
jgi:23S rRNA pseudouridine1911/1915/1917 synthase